MEANQESVDSGLPPLRWEINEVCSPSTRLETAAVVRSDTPLAAFHAHAQCGGTAIPKAASIR